MAVHFTFSASNLYKSVPCVGDFISLSELKDAIAAPLVAALNGKKLKENFDLRVYDHDTKEEIVGAKTRVRKNTSVLVKRVPAFLLSQQHQSGVEDQSNGLKAINKRAKEVINDDFGDDVYSRSTIRKNSKKEERPCIANVVQSLQAPCSEIPLDLMCMLCRNIMEDPMLIPCCCNSFCRNCIRVALTKRRECPKCESLKCSDADLLPNRHVKFMIDAFCKSNPSVSSTGSCSSQRTMCQTTSSLVRVVESQQTNPTKNASYQKTPLFNGMGNGLLGKRKPLVISLNLGAKHAKVN